MDSKNQARARILVIDPLGRSQPLLDELRASGRFEFRQTSDARLVRTLMDWKPNLVLLHVPEEGTAAEEVFDCLEELKQELPVVVMSSAADMGLYMVAMTRGAFDYFTSYTPLDEIVQVLRRAIRWQRARAA